MLILNSKSTKLITPLSLIIIAKRTMMRNVSQILIKPCKIVPTTPFNHTIKRNLPDHGYSIYETTKKIIGKDPKTGHNIYEGDIVTSKGQELPQHENSHGIVRDKETGKDVGILTSAKNPNKGNINIAPENYKGQKLANGDPKPQQYRPYDTPRDTRLCNNIVKNLQATEFVEMYNKELNDAVKKFNNYKKPAIARTDKDSSELYHPDGRAIFDKDGSEIHYDD